MRLPCHTLRDEIRDEGTYEWTSDGASTIFMRLDVDPFDVDGDGTTLPEEQQATLLLTVTDDSEYHEFNASALYTSIYQETTQIDTNLPDWQVHMDSETDFQTILPRVWTHDAESTSSLSVTDTLDSADGWESTDPNSAAASDTAVVTLTAFAFSDYVESLPTEGGEQTLGTIENHSTLVYDETDTRDPFHTIEVHMDSTYDETGTIDTGYSHYESSEILADGTVIARVIHDEYELIDTIFQEEEMTEAVDIQRTETDVAGISIDPMIQNRLWVSGKRGVSGVPLVSESELGVRVYSDYVADGETHSEFRDTSNLTTTGTFDPGAGEEEDAYTYVTSGTVHTVESYEEIIHDYTLTEEQDVSLIEKDYASAHQFTHEAPATTGILSNGMRVITGVVNSGGPIVRATHSSDSSTETGSTSATNSTIVDITHPGNGGVTYEVQVDVTSDYDYTLTSASEFYSRVEGGSTNRSYQTNGYSIGSSIYDYDFTQTDTPSLHPTTQEPVMLSTSQAEYTLDTTWDYDFLTTGSMGVAHGGSSGFTSTEHAHEVGIDHQAAVTTSQTDAGGVVSETDHRERLTDYSGGSRSTLSGSGSRFSVLVSGESITSDVTSDLSTEVTYEFYEDAKWEDGALMHYDLIDVRNFGHSTSVEYSHLRAHSNVDGDYSADWSGSYSRTVNGDQERVVKSASRTATQEQFSRVETETIVGSDENGEMLVGYGDWQETEYSIVADSTLNFDADYTLDGIGGTRSNVSINNYSLQAHSTETVQATEHVFGSSTSVRVDEVTLDLDESASGNDLSRTLVTQSTWSMDSVNPVTGQILGSGGDSNQHTWTETPEDIARRALLPASGDIPGLSLGFAGRALGEAAQWAGWGHPGVNEYNTHAAFLDTPSLMAIGDHPPVPGPSPRGGDHPFDPMGEPVPALAEHEQFTRPPELTVVVPEEDEYPAYDDPGDPSSPPPSQPASQTQGEGNPNGQTIGEPPAKAESPDPDQCKDCGCDEDGAEAGTYEEGPYYDQSGDFVGDIQSDGMVERNGKTMPLDQVVQYDVSRPEATEPDWDDFFAGYWIIPVDVDGDGKTDFTIGNGDADHPTGNLNIPDFPYEKLPELLNLLAQGAILQETIHDLEEKIARLEEDRSATLLGTSWVLYTYPKGPTQTRLEAELQQAKKAYEDVYWDYLEAGFAGQKYAGWSTGRTMDNGHSAYLPPDSGLDHALDALNVAQYTGTDGGLQPTTGPVDGALTALSAARFAWAGVRCVGQFIPPKLVPYGGGPTSGVLRIRGFEDIPLISGYKGPSATMPRGTPGMNGNIKSHVEAHASAILRNHRINKATLYINRRPCPGKWGCDAMLPRMLPENATLRVIGPNGFRHTYRGVAD